MKLSKEFKIGIFFVLIVVVSFFLINYLRGEDLFNREFEVSARYENVEGLVPSAPVYIKGYKAGKVIEVNYDGIGADFEVLCSIRKEFRIPSDSRMTIYSVDIMGGKGVRIDLGSSNEYAEDGSVLSSGFETGLIDGLATSLVPLVSKVNDTLDSLAVSVSGINRLLSDDNQVSLAGTLSHLENTLASAEKVAFAIEGRSEELSSFIGNLSTLSNNLFSISEKVDTTITGISSIVDDLHQADLDSLVISFRSLLENVNDPDGTVGRLLDDDTLYNSVDELLNSIDSFFSKIEENPKKYLRISVF